MEQDHQQCLPSELLTGVPGIDSQHNNLATLCENIPCRLAEENISETYIHALALNLLENINTHVETEETFLGMIDFPGRNKHLEEHRALYRSLNLSPKTSGSYKPAELARLVSSLGESLHAHIRDYDLEFAEHLKHLMDTKKRFNSGLVR